MKGSSGIYTLSRKGNVYSCSCPAWRNQGAVLDRRTCKHLRAYLGEEAEAARTGGAAPAAKARPAKKVLSGGGESEEGEGDEEDKAPPILLAHKWEIEHDPTGWWMSEKLDGVRAYWDGEAFVSRLGNRFYAPEWFTEDLPADTLDGELWVGRKLFSKTISIVRSGAGGEEWKSVSYVVFDAPNARGGFEDRLAHVDKVLKKAQARYARALEHVVCSGFDHLREELTRVERLGGEGLMLREPRSSYTVGRSTSLLKVKTFHDAEGRIVAHVPGAGKHKGRLGAVVCELPSGVTFNIGTGFSDAERRDPPPIGSVVTFRFQELTDDGIPRFPSWVGVRIDAEWPPRSEARPVSHAASKDKAASSKASASAKGSASADGSEGHRRDRGRQARRESARGHARHARHALHAGPVRRLRRRRRPPHQPGSPRRQVLGDRGQGRGAHHPLRQGRHRGPEPHLRAGQRLGRQERRREARAAEAQRGLRRQEVSTAGRARSLTPRGLSRCCSALAPHPRAFSLPSLCLTPIWRFARSPLPHPSPLTARRLRPLADEAHGGRRHPGEAAVPGHGIAGDVAEHDRAPRGVGASVIDLPLAQQVVLVAGGPGEDELAGMAGARRRLDERGLAPAQVAAARQIEHAQLAIVESAGGAHPADGEAGALREEAAGLDEEGQGAEAAAERQPDLGEAGADAVPRAPEVQEGGLQPGGGGQLEGGGGGVEEARGGGRHHAAVVEVQPERAAVGGGQRLHLPQQLARPPRIDVDAEARAVMAIAALDGADGAVAPQERGGEAGGQPGARRGEQGALQLLDGLARDDRRLGELLRFASAGGGIGEREGVAGGEVRAHRLQLAVRGDVEAAQVARRQGEQLGVRERLHREEHLHLGGARRRRDLAHGARQLRPIEEQLRPIAGRQLGELRSDRGRKLGAHAADATRSLHSIPRWLRWSAH